MASFFEKLGAVPWKAVIDRAPGVVEQAGKLQDWPSHPLGVKLVGEVD